LPCCWAFLPSSARFSQNTNLIVAAITIILGTGEFTLKFGDFALGGIGTATFGAILLHALLRRAP
jgi:xanthine/uracil permease